MIFVMFWALTAPLQDTPPKPPLPPELVGIWEVDKTALVEATLIRLTKELGRALTVDERKMIVAETEKTRVTFTLKDDGKAIYFIDMGAEAKPIDGLGRWYADGAKVQLIIRYKWGFRLEPSQQMTGNYHKGVIRMLLARGMPEIILRKKT